MQLYRIDKALGSFFEAKSLSSGGKFITRIDRENIEAYIRMKQKIITSKIYQIAGFPLLLMIFSISVMAKDTCFLQNDIQHGVSTAVGLFTAPGNFTTRDWNRTGLVLAGTTLLFTIDKSVRKLALKNQSSLNDIIFSADKIQGNKYSLFFAGGVYTFGLISNKPGIRITGLHAVEAFIFSGIVTGLSKGLFGRRRPYAGNSPVVFLPFHMTSSTYHSLPSGHTTVSFAVSTVMAKSWDNIAWKIFWYGNAGLVAASRIYHNRHWLSDTFMGTIVGYSVANYIVNSDTKKKLSQKYRIVPQLTLNSIVLNIYLF